MKCSYSQALHVIPRFVPCLSAKAGITSHDALSWKRGDDIVYCSGTTYWLCRAVPCIEVAVPFFASCLLDHVAMYTLHRYHLPLVLEHVVEVPEISDAFVDSRRAVTLTIIHLHFLPRFIMDLNKISARFDLNIDICKRGRAISEPR